MNKILMNNEKNLFSEQEKIEFSKNDTLLIEMDHIQKQFFLVVLDNVCVTLNFLAYDVDFSFHIKLGKNSHLTMNALFIEGSFHIDTSLEGESANFSCNYSMIAGKDSHNTIEVYHHQSNTISHLRNHGFSINKSAIVVDVSSTIFKDASKCISHQDNQIIEQQNSLSQINPNLYIDNYDVDASHSAYVGEFKENELFYLMSRGISMKDAKYLLLKAFLLGNLSLETDMKEKYEKKLTDFLSKEV